ncbi:MAG: sigma 54-interacting transcriptional regulator [Desulfotignum sp.]|nr:sigma 54-interacting transcriptional regulator [Desulfotignum sp.]MCF8126198.1 sigma 54-interacting transcriptional regulator [Desulfotignum sp.]
MRFISPKILLFNSLRTLIFFAVALLVILTGTIVSQIVIKNYSTTLLAGAAAKGENLAHKLALDVTDKILINDLVAVQKILDDQMKSDPAISYLFVKNSGQVLVHTFPDGVPRNLIFANAKKPVKNRVNLVSQTHERFIDIQWPIFEGRAGVVRLGISEAPFRSRIKQLGIRMTLITAGVLAVVLVLSHLLISRLIRPLMVLTDTVKSIDENKLDTRLNFSGPSEVVKLAAAYNTMLEKIAGYTGQLKRSNEKLAQKNQHLDRVHRQMITTFSVSRQIAALPDLNRVTSFLLSTFKEIVACQNLFLVILAHDQRKVFLAVAGKLNPLNEDAFDIFHDTASRSGFPIFLTPADISALNLPDQMCNSSQMAVFPFYYHQQVLGAMLISCPDDCTCLETEMEVIRLILEQASGAVFRALEHERQIQELKARTEQISGYRGMVGKDPKIQVIYKLIQDVAPTDATVLIQGESGTGKEMVARALHEESPRSGYPFVVINCAAYPATLLESELFGHEKGAFTGAMERKIGKFEQAGGGTVFLDEIGEIPMSAQTMLLRVLQSQKIERIGGTRSIKVNIRIVAATNRYLLDEVKQGNFREDLFYRLNVIPINLPALRERKNDVPLLANYFLEKFAAEQHKKIDTIDPETLRTLVEYDWPGNIRELENSIEYAVTLAKSNRIFPGDLPAHQLPTANPRPEKQTQVLQASEKETICQMLDQCNWNKTAAAASLGISRSTLYEKLKKYQIRPSKGHIRETGKR